jgi:hypothetical protein
MYMVSFMKIDIWLWYDKYEEFVKLWRILFFLK